LVTAVSSGCGSSANPNADGEALGEIDQAFSEPNCINALPNTDGSLPGGQNPDGTYTGEMGGEFAPAPYTNPKCGGAWVAQVNSAHTGLRMVVTMWEDSFQYEREGCEDRHVGLLVYSRFLFGSIKGPWVQYFLGRSYAAWGLPGFPGRCHIPDIEAPPLALPTTPGATGRDVKIIGTGRDPNNNTQTIALFGEVY